jgi:hypothetical protein
MLRLPVLAVQAIAKATVVVSPAVTVTVRGFCPATVQLAATPVSCTVYVPGSISGLVTAPLASIAWAAAVPTCTVYPSASGSTPLVAVVISRVPVVSGGVGSSPQETARTDTTSEMATRDKR